MKHNVTVNLEISIYVYTNPLPNRAFPIFLGGLMYRGLGSWWCGGAY